MNVYVLTAVKLWLVTFALAAAFYSTINVCVCWVRVCLLYSLGPITRSSQDGVRQFCGDHAVLRFCFRIKDAAEALGSDE